MAKLAPHHHGSSHSFPALNPPTLPQSAKEDMRNSTTTASVLGNSLPDINVARTAPDSASPEEDFTPWDKKTVLTLDGGGIRGYSSLLILEAVMEEIAHIEQTLLPKASCSAYPLEFRSRKGHAPCQGPSQVKSGSPSAELFYLPSQYFDYIGGTSTGG